MKDEINVGGRLEEFAVPVERADPGREWDDLRPLANVFEGKTVVGLGEATHGTREFFQLKRRLVEFLVTELGVKLFGLEANFTETLAVNDYVVSGEGDPVEALDGIQFWTWQTEEMLGLIEWMREYNDGRPDDETVRFYGYDMQFARGPARAIGGFLHRFDPDYLAEIESALQTLESGLVADGDEAAASWLDAAATVTEGVAARFEDREEAYRSKLTDHQWREVQRHRTTIEQARELVRARLAGGPGAPQRVRDKYMAENVSWLLDHEGEDAIVLWAHNGHILTGEFRGGDWETPPKTMGHHLDEAYGDDYYALGFEFGTGSFQAYPDPETADEMAVRAFSVDSVREGSVPAVLREVGDGPYLVDFESASKDERVAEWLSRERPLHNVGSVYYGDDESYVPVELAAEYDGLAFVPETSRARPL